MAVVTQHDPIQAQPGDPAAPPLEHWPQVFGFAWSLTRDRSRSEDLCQEAYLRLFDRWDKIDTDRSVLPLLLTIVRNLVFGESRRQRPSSLDELHAVDERAETPEEALARTETVQSVREALAALPDHWRAAVYLRDGLGLSYRDIGDVIDASTDTVRTMLHRARQRMRALLSEGSSS